MLKGIATIVVIGILAIGAYFIYSALHKAGEDVNRPTQTIDIAKDQAAKSELVNIKMAIQSYVATNGQLPPAADQGTLGSYMSPWPENPWTKQPMKPGSGEGDYTYTPAGGTSFTLTVHLSDGATASAP